MEARGVRTRRLWHEIKLIIVKTTLAMIPEVMLNYEHYFRDVPGPQCFQIMGFDIIVRKDCMPLLLEVNSAPSLTIEHSGFAETDLTPVRSLVDELIKVPLVRDSMLLVLNKLDENNGARIIANADTLSWESSSINEQRTNHIAEDDLGMIRRKKKAHLSEIFPGRYGQQSKHLLFLDRAVYLFMQFINVKQSILITMGSLKSFIKKCNLSDVITNDELEKKFNQIYFYFTSKESQPSSGLPFHGFLQLLFHFSRLKFPEGESLLDSLQRLLAFCDAALRHYGVRSTRLRRTEIEMDQNTNSVEIYLLPSRMRQHKASATSTRSHFKSPAYMRRSAMRNSRSVPRMQQPQPFKGITNNSNSYSNMVDSTANNLMNGTSSTLPRISVHN
uniref:Tubulin polyglutamylase TTLL11 n=1 Tax=Acrobeloides nanus TaxID=290746 RepID=A0A914D4T5_9BILA